MADIVSPEVRSRMMSGIRGRNTRPEILVRKALHAKGLRYRLHGRKLPGKPDLVLPRWNAVIFVHGCFWHGHDCHLFRWPASRPEFWREKIGANIARDRRDQQALRQESWRVGIVWECALKGRTRLPPEDVASELVAWLHAGEDTIEIQGLTE